MPALAVSAPFPIYPDIDGKSLDNGSIYIGVAGLPAALNPINVYFDEALTQIASQPIATRGGYPVNNGVRCRLFTNSDYSIQVLNSKGTMVYESLNSVELVSSVTASAPLASSGGTTPNLSLAGAVPVANGGTALTATPTNGQIPIGNGSGYTLATITAGTGITVTNGAGSISISAAGLPVMNVVSGTSQLAVAGNHYVITNVALTTITLPATPAAGDVVWVTVANSLTTNVIARNGQNIMGLAEDMTLNATYAAVQLRFVNASLGWRII